MANTRNAQRYGWTSSFMAAVILSAVTGVAWLD